MEIELETPCRRSWRCHRAGHLASWMAVVRVKANETKRETTRNETKRNAVKIRENLRNLPPDIRAKTYRPTFGEV